MGKWYQSDLAKFLSQCFLVILGCFVTYILVVGKESATTLKAELDSRPKYEYVDKQDASIIVKINDHVSADDKKDQMTIKWMESVDRKLDILITDKK